MKIRTTISWCMALLVAAALFSIYSSVYAAKDRTAVLINVRGDVMIKEAGSDEWTTAVARTELSEGDQLRTGKGSTAIIRMDDGSMAKIAPLSGMSINPARTFASALPAGLWTALWVYFTAPVLGMIAASLVYQLIRSKASVKCAKLNHHTTRRCIFCGFGINRDSG